MKQFKAIAVILFLLLVVVLAVQNYEALSTSIRFQANLYFAQWQSSGIPVFLIAVICFLIGVLSMWIYSLSERFQFKRQVRALARDVSEKEKELNSLRNLPVTGDDMSTSYRSDGA